MSTPPPEPEITADAYRQRALLLADLGRYDEAAGELAAGLAAVPDDPGLLTTLARVHLAADQPGPALTAADRAAAAAPRELAPQVVRAMALIDTRRYGEAATVAGGILQRWRDDPFAQRTGAALLSESRNGQEALNAAWEGVRTAPTEAEAHLVLAVVAARLRLFDLAQRAYAEALDLDPAVGDAQRDVGVVRLERRRWARALEALADAASLPGPADGDPAGAPPADGDPPGPRPADGDPPGSPPGGNGPTAAPPGALRADRPETGGEPPASGHPVGPPGPPAGGPSIPVSRPTGPVLDPYADTAGAVRDTVLHGATGVLVLAVLTAGMSQLSSGASRVWGVAVGACALLALRVVLGRRLTEPVGAALRRVRRREPRLVAAVALAVAAATLLVAYGPVGGPVPLVAAMAAAGAAAVLAALRRAG